MSSGCLHSGKIPTANTRVWIFCMQEASNIHCSDTNLGLGVAKKERVFSCKFCSKLLLFPPINIQKRIGACRAKLPKVPALLWTSKGKTVSHVAGHSQSLGHEISTSTCPSCSMHWPNLRADSKPVLCICQLGLRVCLVRNGQQPRMRNSE